MVLLVKCRLFWYSWPSASIKDAVRTYVKWHIPVYNARISFLSFVISRLLLMPKTVQVPQNGCFLCCSGACMAIKKWCPTVCYRHKCYRFDYTGHKSEGGPMLRRALERTIEGQSYLTPFSLGERSAKHMSKPGFASFGTFWKITYSCFYTQLWMQRLGSLDYACQCAKHPVTWMSAVV